MFKRIKEMLGVRFARIWLLILMLMGGVLAARQFLFVNNSPTLQEVLAKEPVSSLPDYPLLIVVILASALAAVSIAKTYEIFKRSRPIGAALLPEEIEEVAAGIVGREAEGMEQKDEGLAVENAELRKRLKKIEASLKEAEQVEQMLRKSNISLSKECERLKSDNEARALKNNSISMKSKRARPKVRRKTAMARKRRTRK
jgi:hypothetical protein